MTSNSDLSLSPYSQTMSYCEGAILCKSEMLGS